MGCQEVGTDRGSGRSGSVGPCRHACHKPWRALKPEPLANPLLGKWLCVLKDARRVAPSSAALCQTWSGPTAIGDPCRYCRPLGRIVFARKPLATVRVRAAHVREWLPCLPHSLGDYGAHARACKSASKLPPAEPFATGICARPNIANGSARVKDPSLPQARPFTTNFSSSHCSCLRSLSKRLIVSTSDPMS